jgi:hypothetical protein
MSSGSGIKVRVSHPARVAFSPYLNRAVRSKRVSRKVAKNAKGFRPAGIEKNEPEQNTPCGSPAAEQSSAPRLR